MTKEKKKSLLITICAILAVVLVLGLVVYNRLYDSGVILRSKTAASSEHYKVSGTMMAYFYNTQYQSYYSYFSYLGIQTGTSLKSQACSFLSDGGSWFDYFMSNTESYVANMLELCEGAHEAGITLDADDKAAIEENIDALEETAKAYGYNAKTYLLMTMSNPVSVGDVRKCMELNALAQKYYNSYMDSLSYTDEQIEAYYNENASTFEGVDYYSYTLYATDFAEYDENENPTTTSAENSAKAYEAAQTLAAATTASAFEDALRTLAAKEGTTEDSVESAVANAYHRHVLASSIPSISDWAFSANVGESKIDGEEGATTYTVYLLTAAPYRDEQKTRDVRHILFQHDNHEDSSAADAAYAEWEAAGFTEEKFIEMVPTYSEDPGSVDNGGLYENVAEGDMVTEFNDWLFDASRKPGDHGLIEAASTGWHLMYYVGEGDKAGWQNTVESALKSADYNEMLNSYSSGINFNSSVYADING
ncbi:MAG: peptidyl-prolyl cis-trans isomerase [Clostridiales bacterium]|nr:peptidyl-prolyl cis-trans isomerase [Clostridiales bacterium]